MLRIRSELFCRLGHSLLIHNGGLQGRLPRALKENARPDGRAETVMKGLKPVFQVIVCSLLTLLSALAEQPVIAVIPVIRLFVSTKRGSEEPFYFMPQ